MTTRLTWPTGPVHQDGSVRPGVRRTRFDIEALESRTLLSGVGNIFVANSATHGVSEISTNGTLLNSALIAGVGEAGIAVSGSDLFIVNGPAGTVGEYTTAGGTVNAKLLSGLIGPDRITIAGADLFVVDDGDSRIGEYTLTGMPVNSSLVTGLSDVRGIAADSSDLFVMYDAPGSLYKTIAEYTTNGALVNATLITGVDAETGLTLSGPDLFVADTYTGDIGEYTTAGATVNATLIQDLDDGNESELGSDSIAVVGSDLFLINANGSIGAYTSAGQIVNNSLISDLYPAQLASDGSNLFFLNRAGLEGLPTVSEYTPAGVLVSPSLIPAAGDSGIAVWGPDLFLTNSDAGTIAEYTTSGVLVNPALVTGLSTPGALAVFGQRLFVADSAGVGEYTTSGQTINATLIAEHYVGSIHLFGSNLLVASYDTIGEFSMTGATINPALATVEPMDGAQAGPIVDFTVSGNDLFIATGLFEIPHPSILLSGVIAEFTTSGAEVNPSLISVPDNIYGGVASFEGIAMFGSTLYVTEGDSDTVAQYNLAGVLQGTDNYTGGFLNPGEEPICIEPVAGPATQLVAIQPPAFVSVGSAVSPPIIIAVEDADGNVVTDDSSTITLTAATGATIGGTLSQPVAGGVVIFSDITFPNSGSYALTASDAALPAATFSLTASDLAPVVTSSTVPSSVVAGVALRARQIITVTNDSNTVQRGLVYIRIYATTDGAVDQAATLIATRRERVAIKPGGHVVVRIPIASLPAGLAGGKYTLLVQTTDPAGMIRTAVSGPAVNVTAPFVALQAVIPTLPLPPTFPGNEHPRSTIRVAVENNGNLTYHGRTTIALYLSADGKIDDIAALVARVTRYPRIAPNEYASLNIPVRAIANLPAGAYSLVLQVTDATDQISSAVYSPVVVQTVGFNGGASKYRRSPVRQGSN